MKHNTIFLDAYLDSVKNNRIIKPHDFMMKYQQFERHMLMYFPDQM